MVQKVFATISQKKTTVWEEFPDTWTVALKMLVGKVIQSHYVSVACVPKANEG